MIVLINTACPECRTLSEDCHHRNFGPRYVARFQGTTTITTSKLDDAMTFESIAEAQRYYDESGVRCSTIEPRDL